MFKQVAVIFGVVLVILTQACTQHKVEVEPVEIKPIHITIDVNVRMQKALDDFFDDIDEADKTDESADKAPSSKE